VVKNEKLSGGKLLCKVFKTKQLQMPLKIIDQNILLRRSGLRRTGKKMKDCSTKNTKKKDKERVTELR